MRLAHVTLIMSCSAGALSIARKLDSQAHNAQRAKVPLDFYWLCNRESCPERIYNHLRVVPVEGHNAFQVRQKQVETIHRLLDTYDRVILRYPLFDPVLGAMLRGKRRIILEHHTKEIEELKLSRDPRWVTEWLFGGAWIRSFGGLTAVTREILEYEATRSRFRGKSQYFPNSIDTSTYRVRSHAVRDPGNDTLKLCMAASSFTPWQGLEIVLDALHSAIEPSSWELHLAGQLPSPLLSRVKADPQCVIHGSLAGQQLGELYDQCAVGIGAYNIAAKGLKQATCLKVRDYLASGLPVVLEHVDPALGSDFPYAITLADFNLKAVQDFVDKISSVRRNSIQDEVRPLIDSTFVNHDLYRFCCGTHSDSTGPLSSES